MKTVGGSMWVLVITFAFLLPQPTAGGQEKSRIHERWKRDDKNADGRVSRDEFTGPTALFDRLDRNGDGFIEEGELGRGRQDRRSATFRSTGKEVTFKSSDGLTVFGIQWKPEGEGPFPAIVLAHGGVHGRTRPDAGDALAREGYVVLGVDHRGSEGYGDEYKNNLSVGDMEIEDVVAGGKYLQTLPYVDGSRMGIKGGSHGGYITVCTIERTNIFKAAVEINGFVDLKKQYEHEKKAAPNFMGIWHLAREVTPEEGPKLYHDRSPLFFVEKIQTPLLILHGEHDTLVLPEQSKLLAEQLKKHKKTFEFHIIKGTPQTARHGLRGEAAREANRLVDEWFARHLKR